MIATATPSSDILAGHHVFFVEDETAVSFLVEDMILELGAQQVTYAASVGGARASLATVTPTLALLDVNLAGETVYPIAEELVRRRIPFVFLTGYGRDGIALPWSNCPVLQKPVDLGGLEAKLREVLAAART